MEHMSQTLMSKSWREKRLEKREIFNPKKEVEKESKPSPDDLVLKHPKNGANIRIKDNGTIQMFADNQTGIKIDPNNNTIMMMAENTSIKSSKIHFKADDLEWNYCPFNDDLKNPFRELISARRFGTKALNTALGNAGAYMSPVGPVTSGTVGFALEYADLEGSRVYSNLLPPTMQKVYGVSRDSMNLIRNSIKDSIPNID